jgi:predicted esterase
MRHHHIRTEVSGRYLVDAPEGDGPFPLLAGFHGYGQTAEAQMELLRRIPGSERRVCCSIEALHPFMNKKGEPGASWMTRRDRELRIEENVGYVDAVLDAVRRDFPESVLVLHGFSQGAGMACRAAMLGRHDVAGVMVLGGDIPPELGDLRRMGRVQLARGERDRFYTMERLEADRARLFDAGLSPDVVTFRGSHGPTGEYFVEAGRFLDIIDSDGAG